MAKAKSLESNKPGANGAHGSDRKGADVAVRAAVLKTYKLFIGGSFPRSESGRYYQALDSKGVPTANVCLGSRKDIREAVVAARAAQSSWAARSSYNRAQILYRMAEILESRIDQFASQLTAGGPSPETARVEVLRSIDRIVYFAGWCDKYSQVFGSVNPVASSHFNFSVPEPMGVIGIVAPGTSPLLGLVSNVLPAIAGGNTVVVLASEAQPLSAIDFAEVLGVSDLPGGVVNIITGRHDELLQHFATHMDINAVVYCGASKAEQVEAEKKKLQSDASINVKRTIMRDKIDWKSVEIETPYAIMDCQEIKTTWHPIERIGGSGGGY